MAIVVIGTLDTKGAELDFVRQTLQNYGHSVILIDASVLGSSPISSDISPAEVFAAAGVSLNAVQAQNNRGQAVE
ncbi:MAG: Tm-1-like ATP-binding domain-containing protein, partial [Gemmataceae bacterium]|nr:Tm-1-like ATP-binding domain-containing protein [Gemmataceae bacterium]